MAGDLMAPLEAITREPPNVWLTSFYGFDPSNWGYLGFSTDTQRNSFLRRSQPGALVVIYVVGDSKRKDFHRVVGVLQCSHRVDHAKAFMSPLAWKAKQSDPERVGRWELGVKAVRAWRIAPESQLLIDEFADKTYRPDRGQVIGSQGMQLTATEARRLLTLDLQQVSVCGEEPILAASVGLGADILVPSKPGPVSQTPYVAKEAEGPKSLYILKLEGDLNSFLGREVGQLQVVKVGVSRSPKTRCIDHNQAWPRCSYFWTVQYSNEIAGLAPFPDSRSSIAGETEAKRLLVEGGESLGGEFFLAPQSVVDEAWGCAVKLARGGSPYVQHEEGE